MKPGGKDQGIRDVMMSWEAVKMKKCRDKGKVKGSGKDRGM